jgi:hypothetical protein
MRQIFAFFEATGRVTYQGIAQYFPKATDRPYAEVMNKASKSVFFGTLKATDSGLTWSTSTA